MKLHWKIFLISLVFIMAAVGSVSVGILQYSFANEVKSEKLSAVMSHSYFVATLNNKAQIERVEEASFVLSSDAMISSVDYAVSSAGASDGSDITGVYIEVSGYDCSYSNGKNEKLLDKSLFPDSTEEGKCYTYIYDTEEGVKLAAASSFELEGYDVKAYSLYDVNGIYEEHEREFRFLIIISVITSVVVSVLLFAVSFFLLYPLKRVYSALDRVAAGEYDVRLPVCGGREFRQMSENINTMTESVEKNVNKLEAIADGRKQYVDRLAHEMKTPLTSILCFGDLLRIKKKVSDKERIEYAGVIVDEAKRMKNMSSKLLELAVAESAEIELVPTSVMSILTECVNAMMPAFEKSGIGLTVSELSEDGIILCDRELFKSLIFNITDNARKASEKGQTVTVFAGKSDGKMLISVKDEGIGMTKEVLKKVTMPFYMADKNRSRRQGGAGIGLSLCVEIAKRHGAVISAKSRPGKGTTMTITVPLADKKKDEGGAHEEG